MSIRQVTPKVGDTISGHGEITKVEDVGHDRSLQYTLDDGKTIMGAYGDFSLCDLGCWHYNRKWYSSWGE